MVALWGVLKVVVVMGCMMGCGERCSLWEMRQLMWCGGSGEGVHEETGVAVVLEV